MDPSTLVLADIFKTLAEPTRLQIVLALTPDGKWVNLLVQETGFAQPLVSHHLKVLRDQGLVRAERRGPFNHYGLVDEAVWKTVEACIELAASLRGAEQVQGRRVATVLSRKRAARGE